MRVDRRQTRRPNLLTIEEILHFARHIPRVAHSIGHMGVRQSTVNDLQYLLRIEEAAWYEDGRASADMLQSRIETFPEGALCATMDGELVGFACWQIISQSLNEIIGDWSTLTDSGFIKKTHDPVGQTLFGVNLSTLPRAPRDVVWAISEASKKLTIRLGLSYFVLGSRIPGFRRFAAEMDVETYIHTLRSGRYLDPEVDLYTLLGLTPIRILPNFFSDPQSHNFGVLMSWKNPFSDMQDCLNLWEEYRWFDLWRRKFRWRKNYERSKTKYEGSNQ